MYLSERCMGPYKLESLYGQSSAACKNNLLKKFFDIKMADGDTLKDYVTNVEFVAHQLTAANESLNDDFIIAKLLSGLRNEFAYFNAAWDSTAPSERTLRNLIERLLKEDGHKAQATAQTSLTAQKFKNSNKKKFNGLCKYCNLKGHMWRDCRKRKKEHSSWYPNSHEKQNLISRSQSLSTSNSAKDNWIFDSGSTNHVCCDSKYFVELKPNLGSRSILTGGGFKHKIEGRGVVKFMAKLGNRVVETFMSDVYYVTSLARNLISQSVLQAKGCGFISKEGSNSIKVTRNYQVVLEANPTTSPKYTR